MKSKPPPENHSTRTSRRRFAKSVVAAAAIGVKRKDIAVWSGLAVETVNDIVAKASEEHP